MGKWKHGGVYTKYVGRKVENTMSEKLYAFCEGNSSDVTKKVVHGIVKETFSDGRVTLKNPNVTHYSEGAIFKPICVVPYDEGMLLKQKWDDAVKLYNDKHDYIKSQCAETIKLLADYGSHIEKPFKVSLSERDIYVIYVALHHHYMKMVDDNGEAKNPDHAEFVKDLYPLYQKFDKLAEKPGEVIW